MLHIFIKLCLKHGVSSFALILALSRGPCLFCCFATVFNHAVTVTANVKPNLTNIYLVGLTPVYDFWKGSIDKVIELIMIINTVVIICQ